MYGDFGRYIFQSALQYFDVDEYSIFNYSIYYILNELGYDNKLFDDYDDMVSGFSWDRFDLIKIERIGKKYQWIAMHNILARVSDYYQMKKDFLMEDEPIDYEGPWNPFVRDFDPSLDYCDYRCEETTSFSEINEHIQQVSQTLHEKREDPSFDEKKWIKQKPELFAYHKDDLIIKVEKGRSWVSLTKYEEIDNGVKESDGINTWSWLYGYFVTNEQLLHLKNKADNKDSLLTNEITTIPDTYYLFNREYPWSSANYLVLENQWRNINTNTSSEEGISLSNNKVLCTTQYISWEKQYDASNEAGVSLFHPCADFINEFNLQQKDKDGIYYNNENEKVAFDSTLINRKAGLVVRKDFLDTFLDNNEYKLVWFVNASKEIHYERPFSGLFSDWIGLLEYTDSKIKGEYYEK